LITFFFGLVGKKKKIFFFSPSWEQCFFSSFYFHINGKYAKKDLTLNGNQSVIPIQKNSFYNLATLYNQELKCGDSNPKVSFLYIYFSKNRNLVKIYFYFPKIICNKVKFFTKKRCLGRGFG